MLERSRHLWSIPLAALLILVAGCEGEPRAKKRPKVNVQPREIIGKTTQDIRAAEPEIKQEGAQVASTKITAKDPITLSGNAYVSIIGQASILQIQHTLDLYHAQNERYPKDVQEFMDEVIKPNGIRLPQLPAYQEYGYDAENHKLVVLEYPERREELKRQFQEKISAREAGPAQRGRCSRENPRGRRVGVIRVTFHGRARSRGTRATNRCRTAGLRRRGCPNGAVAMPLAWTVKSAVPRRDLAPALTLSLLTRTKSNLKLGSEARISIRPTAPPGASKSGARCARSRPGPTPPTARARS